MLISCLLDITIIKGYGGKDDMNKEVDDFSLMYDELADIDPELADIVIRVICDDPHKEDLQRLRKSMEEDPEGFSMAFNIRKFIEVV